jgi:hypothetical protein
MRVMYAPDMVSIEGDGSETVGKSPTVVCRGRRSTGDVRGGFAAIGRFGAGAFAPHPTARSDALSTTTRDQSMRSAA